jgi:Grx4 family monothiol glutaredoxin
MSTVKEITSLEEWESHLTSLPASALLIVSFHAPWAAPCAAMATVLSTLAAGYPSGPDATTSWVSINAEDLSDISETYNVTAVPFLVLIRDGKVLETVSGSSAVKVRAAIEKHAAAPSSSANTTSQTAPAVAESQPEVQQAEEETDPAKKKEELFKRLDELVRAAPVMLFMKGTPSAPQCGFSRQLVAILREQAVKYGFFNILADDEVRQGLKEYAEWPTFPQLWVDGELVGGLDIVSHAIPSFSVYCEATNANCMCENRSKRRWVTTRSSLRRIASARPTVTPLLARKHVQQEVLS